MKRLFILLVCFLTFVGVKAQTMDATTLYSEFSRQLGIMRSSAPHSVEYERASQAMLQMYPQLYNQAAYFSQHGNAKSALAFAQAYVDMAMMPQFADMHLESGSNYATMTYFVASTYYNYKDYQNAALYLQRYITCGEDKNRKTVYLFLAKSLENCGRKDEQLTILDSALEEFPTDQNLLAMAINTRLEKGYYEDALVYVDKALKARPGDAKLTSLKGQCLEGQGRYEQAAGVYELLSKQQNSLNIYKHFALNLFNCAVQYNEISVERSQEYFRRAIPVLKQIVANDPTSVQYTTALAMSYLYTDQYDDMATVNSRLHAMGAPEVGTGNATQSPHLLASDLKKAQSAPAKSVSTATAAQSATAAPNFETEKTQPAEKNAMDFRAYAQTYIEKEINQWQQKDPYETIDEYTQRVTEQTRNDKVAALMNEAKRTYVDKYERQIRRSDFTIQPYDAENNMFLINSRYGDILLPVPRVNDEARNFANNWMSVTIENPKMDIAGNELVIRSVDFVTQNGIVYHYSDKDEAKYSQTDINLQFNKIDYAGLDQNQGGGKNKVQVQKQNITVGESDVDINVPETKTVRNKTFAFVIGNENYQMVTKVPFALHDAQTMAVYYQKALGIPQSNIRVYKDATYGQLMKCVRDIKSISEAYNGDIEIIFYYAGHGIPDEKTKSAFLLPVDADGTQTDACYSVARLYTELGQLGAKSVIVMMDACFSGSQRGEGMIAQARGVALKAKPDTPQGKMVTLSAATGEETAYPYDDKQHGMFTYYVLKHWQNTKGKTTMGELADYVQTQVRQQSVVINQKSQTPTVNASDEAADWRKWSWK